MGVWKSENTVVTDAGMGLLASLTGQKEIELSRVVAGADYTDFAELSKLTAITHIKKEMAFSSFSDQGDGTAIVDVYIDNSDVTEEFYHQQIGIYARDNSGTEVLFLVAQATSPDYITLPDTPLYITHRIFLKYSGYPDVTVSVSFSGVVTREILDAELAKKENAIDKLTAFNRDFCEDVNQIRTLAKTAAAGGLNEVARADHVHPVGTLLKYAQNAWGGDGRVNLIPDTDEWVMSSGKAPTLTGDYAFEATFQMAWEGFSCFFSDDLLTAIEGKTIEFGVSYLTGASARLELVIDGAVANYITETGEEASVQVEVPQSVNAAALRIIIFSDADLHCKFEGVYMKDTSAGGTAASEDAPLYLEVRKVKKANLPSSAVPGGFYITEDGGMYLGRDDGKYLPLGGSAKL